MIHCSTPKKAASLQNTVRNIPPGEVGTSSLTQKCLKKHGTLLVPRRVWDLLKSRPSTPGPPETHPGIHRLKAPGFKQPSTGWLGQAKKGRTKKGTRLDSGDVEADSRHSLLFFFDSSWRFLFIESAVWKVYIYIYYIYCTVLFLLKQRFSDPQVIHSLDLELFI